MALELLFSLENDSNISASVYKLNDEHIKIWLKIGAGVVELFEEDIETLSDLIETIQKELSNG